MMRMVVICISRFSLEIYSVQDREFLYSRLVSVFQCCNLTDDSSEYTKSIVGAFIAICIQSFDLSIYSEEVKPTTATSQNEVFVDDGGEDIEANETTKEGASSSTSSLPPPPILVAPRKQSYLAFREGARIRVFFRAVFDRWWSLADAEMLMTILQEQLALGPSPPRHIAAFNIGCLFVVLGMMDSLYAKRVALRAIKFVGSDATIIKYRQRRALIKQLERTLIPKADNIFLLCLKILVRRTDVDEILDSAQSLFETGKNNNFNLSLRTFIINHHQFPSSQIVHRLFN